MTCTYRGYNTNGTSYAQAVAVVDANDVIVMQSIPTYDTVGYIISQANFDRKTEGEKLKGTRAGKTEGDASRKFGGP